MFSINDFNKRNLSIHPEDHQSSLASPVYQNGKINLDNSSFKGNTSITSNPQRMRFRKRVFSPVEQRRPILKSKVQMKEIRQTSLASKIIHKNIRSKPSSPVNRHNVMNFTLINENSMVKKKPTNLSQHRSNNSQSSSPKETVFSHQKLNILKVFERNNI